MHEVRNQLPGVFDGQEEGKLAQLDFTCATWNTDHRGLYMLFVGTQDGKVLVLQPDSVTSDS